MLKLIIVTLFDVFVATNLTAIVRLLQGVLLFVYLPGYLYCFCLNKRFAVLA